MITTWQKPEGAGGRKIGSRELDGRGVKLFSTIKLKRKKVSGINQANNSRGATIILS